jgi:F-box protein 21
LEEWKNLSLGESISLERALGAFDMFVIHDTYGDLVEVGSFFHLDYQFLIFALY